MKRFYLLPGARDVRVGFRFSRQEHYSQRIVEILYRYIPWDGLLKFY